MLKLRKTARFVVAALLAGGLALAGSTTAEADPLYWDISDTAGIQGGDGAWDINTINWNPAADGSGTRVVWANGSEAIINASADSTLTAGGTTDTQTSGMTFTGSGEVTIIGTLRLDSGGFITVEAGAGPVSFTSTGNNQGIRPDGSTTFTFTNNSDELLSIGRIQRNGNPNNSLVFAGSGDISVTQFANIGTGDVTMNGAGTLSISNRNNPNTGTVTLSGGTFNLTGSGNFSTRTDASTLIMANNAILQTNHDRSNGISNNTHGVTLNAGGGTFDPTGATTLTINGVIEGIGQLTMDGTGTLALGGDNTYSGSTTISDGTLLLTGSLANGNISVSGGTLSGDGLINFLLGETPDLISLLSGTLDISDMNISFLGDADLTSYLIVDYSAGGSLLTSANLATDSTFANAFDIPEGYMLVNDLDTQQIMLVLIPEPTSAALLGLAGLALLRRRAQQ